MSTEEIFEFCSLEDEGLEKEDVVFSDDIMMDDFYNIDLEDQDFDDDSVAVDLCIETIPGEYCDDNFTKSSRSLRDNKEQIEMLKAMQEEVDLLEYLYG